MAVEDTALGAGVALLASCVSSEDTAEADETDSNSASFLRDDGISDSGGNSTRNKVGMNCFTEVIVGSIVVCLEILDVVWCVLTIGSILRIKVSVQKIRTLIFTCISNTRYRLHPFLLGTHPHPKLICRIS